MFTIPVVIVTGSIIEGDILTTVIIAIRTLTEALILTEALLTTPTVIILSMIIDTTIITAAGIKIDDRSHHLIKIYWLKPSASLINIFRSFHRTLDWIEISRPGVGENPMTMMTVKTTRRAALVALINSDRTRTINALKQIHVLTVAPGSLDEARALVEIADYWLSKDGNNEISWKFR